MIEIDGSYREGGGQILRTALSLSCLFQRPFTIFNIRRGRGKPGLMPQHLTCVRAAKLLSGAESRGDRIGSMELSFSPGEVRGGDFFFDIGTAGSTSLVFQTLAPAIVFSWLQAGRRGEVSDPGKTALTLKGGTHVPFSPSFHYLNGVFVPVLRTLGINMTLTIDSYGFYPKGGGRIRAETHPAKEIGPLKVVEPGSILSLKGFSGVGNLPASIAERQKNALLERIYSQTGGPSGPVDIEILNVTTPGQGTFIYLQSESENSIAGFTSVGERGKRAEIVGKEPAEEFLDYYATCAALDPHLSDQIVLYLALCGEESEFTTSRITEHLMTNLWVIRLFHQYRFSVEGDVGQPGRIRINPAQSTD